MRRRFQGGYRGSGPPFLKELNQTWTKYRITALRYDIEDEYNSWYEEVIHFASKVGVNITSPRGPGPRSSLQIYRANAPSTCPKEYYLRNLAMPFADYLLAEFNSRFNTEDRKGIEILALLPGAITLGVVDLESVLIGLMFWGPDLPFSSLLRSEMKEWQRYWSSKEPNQLSVNLSECLSHADEDIFPNILTLLKLDAPF
ncbi:A disintegrin and metalloproteinase with thrombospondin motifs 3-like [Oopsacas minuta]|uniref:A disintegrin and metalloproteinase with thrombospondin motifs 3-like n=1 Tax=Oopsacas minuta TaxID=111878 RepID=A0AAV7JG84_9METZ|nr:A disintegrin and metalloproteinase with thrombospondin motifs 3-like [Oopsacas minuta]